MIDLLSHQITAIQASYDADDGELFSLIFFNGQKEIARIGDTLNIFFGSFMMIYLQEGEILCGVSTSNY